jgi:hypothetical protein
LDPMAQVRILTRQPNNMGLKMANIRCKEEHSEPLIKNARTRQYVARIEPLNYPDTDVICGTTGCTRPGLVHLDKEEWLVYQ